jgi:hypothetical protein
VQLIGRCRLSGFLGEGIELCGASAGGFINTARRPLWGASFRINDTHEYSGLSLSPEGDTWSKRVIFWVATDSEVHLIPQHLQF